MKYSYKVYNPFDIEQKISLEIHVNDDLELDYEKATWVAVDTEFLSLNQLQDQLCVIQIASIIDSVPRVEILPVFNKKPGKNLTKLMTNSKIGKIFHYSKADMPRIESFIGKNIEGKIFDTYIASRLILTNVSDYSLEGTIQYLVNPKYQKNKKITESEWDLPVEMWEEEQIEYSANDVLYLEAIMKKLEAIAHRRGKTEILKKVMELTPDMLMLINNGYDLSKLF